MCLQYHPWVFLSPSEHPDTQDYHSQLVSSESLPSGQHQALLFCRNLVAIHTVSRSYYIWPRGDSSRTMSRTQASSRATSLKSIIPHRSPYLCNNFTDVISRVPPKVMPNYKSHCAQKSPKWWLPLRIYSYLNPDQQGLTPHHSLQR